LETNRPLIEVPTNYDEFPSFTYVDLPHRIYYGIDPIEHFHTQIWYAVIEMIELPVCTNTS